MTLAAAPMSEGSQAAQSTGERMAPESATPSTFWEHIYRYRFSTRFARGKLVLDLACGSGYGSAALLAAGAKSVIGIDNSIEACEHAKASYGISAICASAEALPLPRHTVDVIVSFETIEHVASPLRFLNECRRLLKSKGVLVLSTPNREIYSENGKHNPFHSIEFNLPELDELLRSRFSRVELFSQRPREVAWWSTRSVAADRTNWINVRGFWRLRKLLRDYTRLSVWQNDLSEDDRRTPIKHIAASNRPLSSLANGYDVRRWSHFHRERPYYFIAVARV